MPQRLSAPLPDRAGIALQNLLAGSPEATMRSLISPDTLTPTEHRDLVEKWFGPGESAGKSLARFTLNPLTIGAIALAVKWPTPRMETLKASFETLVQYDRYLPGILRKLSGLFEIFHGTGIDDAFAYVTRERAANHTRFVVPGLGKALDEFATTAGHLPEPLQQIKMGYAWDMSQPGYAAKLAGFLNGKLDKAGSSIRVTAKDLLPKAPLDALESKTISLVQSGTTKPLWGIFEEAAAYDRAHKGAGVVKALKRDLGAQGVISDALPQKIENHFAHLAYRGPVEIQEAFAQTGHEVLGRSAQRGINVAAAERQTTGQIADRYYRMMPNARHVRMLAEEGVVDRKVAEALDQVKKHGTDIREMVPEYDLRMSHVVERQSDAMTRVYVWRVKRDIYKDSVGGWVAGRTRELANSKNLSNQRNAQLLMDTYIPAALGRSSVEQYSRGLEWGGLRNWTASMLASPKVQNTLGPGITKRLTEMLHYGTGFTTWHGAGGKVASWFYLSTLGFNPATAAQNLLQTILTTGSIVKPQYILESVQDTWKGFAKVQGLVRKGASEHEALTQIFPAFAKQGLELEPLYAEAIAGAKEVLPGVSRSALGRTGVSGVARGFSDRALALFGLTERFNHLVSFNAAHRQALAEGLDVVNAGEVAAKVTRLGQLWAGPYSIPSGFVNLPAPLRQFISFPAKILNMFATSAISGIPGVGPATLTGQGWVGPTVFNPGTLGRAVVGSMAAYEAGRGLLDTDLSNSLLFGAVPGPNERGPFAPLPVVPPALALGGAAALDIAKGEFNETKRVLPLLIPGGVAAARALPMLAGQFSQPTAEAVGAVFGRPTADYTRPTPDGRVPVFSADGSLVGNMTPVEIFRRAMGLGGEEAANEQVLTKYLVKQRDQIRAYRRKYITLLMEHDPDEAEKLNRDYQKRLNLGPIQVKDSDRRAYTMRNDISRLERIMATMPEESRGLYSGIIGTVFSNAGPHMLGVDPAMLSSGSIKSRHPSNF